jgi:CRP/FNR family cyclic AMP-dependent transcriptional regulator
MPTTTRLYGGSRPATAEADSPGSFSLLRRTELKRFLNDAQLDEVERYCRSATRKSGTSLFRQDEPAEHLYLLVEGTVELRARPPGRRVYRTVELIRPGCTFGDEAVVGSPAYLSSARTVEPAKLLVLPRSAYDRMAEVRPDIALGIVRCAGSCLLHTVGRAAILTQAPAEIALRNLLEELAAGSGTRNGRPVPVRITHAQLAGVLHLSRETVSRMLGQMATEGAIELGRGVIRHRRS